MKFRKINVSEIKGNPFDMIGKKWMLITAGNSENFNTMTASWGAVGILWGKPVAYCNVRHSRYTYGFMESGDYYTLSFYPERYREQLNLCGTKSGRDVDKVRATGFTPAVCDCGAVYFEEAEMVLVCRKLYHTDMSGELMDDKELDKQYADGDYHRMYIGEIIEVLEK